MIEKGCFVDLGKKKQFCHNKLMEDISELAGGCLPEE